mmetsp:Transcript_24969/g.37349  ORF Transcript_24969/g.37349 Transcript_24969/m.37349 type:complete len:416 (-) Transcript_24969:61-1308(-)|eukprot:CAMPEP_0116013402 /NCGR_PEP_ID=MMETSP0321-20121206/5707_1 /TAXON_ID=163516 /ORGANISM="Leptocylindrus danicus var. danicus, Strain B650" /LENGTH=415 /DNA_ID=CAMNT_0003482949 /DNA_START=156 /DNA_END=1403 /DNA_ORIENTATION=-
MVSAAWQAIRRIPVQYPLSFGVVISTVKTSASDLLVQKVVERRENIDWKRNGAFALFGCFYLGGFQYFLYVPVFGRIFPNAAKFAAKPLREKLKDIRGCMNVGSQVFLDQCVHHPLMYFPAFYLVKDFVATNGNPDISRVLSDYKKTMKEDLIALWKVWVPSTLLNFAFMPMWARIPWVAGTSALWTCILSAMRGASVSDIPSIDAIHVTGASFKIIEEGIEEIFPCPVELDKDLSHFCISASGPDKTGWVALVADEVAKNGGNVTHSKMVRLGSEFIILMHVAVAPETKGDLMIALRKSKELAPLNIRCTSLNRRETKKTASVKGGYRIHCHGEDKPGMLASIAKKVANNKLSIENITTEIRVGKHGRRDFVVNIDCVLTDDLGVERREDILNDLLFLKSDLSLDYMDIRLLQL